MPELAEAQSAVNMLNPLLFRATIVGVGISSWYEKARGSAGLKAMLGWTFQGVSRRGKSILFEFPNGGIGSNYLLSRLGMTGHWLLCPPCPVSSVGPNPVVRFFLSFPNGDHGELLYFDKRRFGTLQIAPSPREFTALEALGPDPLSAQFSAEWVLACAHRHNVPTKALLTRPEYFPGIGNWVANEALFRAGVAPESPARGMTAPQAARIATALLLTIRNGIAKGGATLKDWRTPDGKPGRAQEDFAVYGRAFKPCPVCGTRIRKFPILGRPTFKCDSCQSGIEREAVSEEFVAQVLKSTEGLYVDGEEA